MKPITNPDGFTDGIRSQRLITPPLVISYGFCMDLLSGKKRIPAFAAETTFRLTRGLQSISPLDTSEVNPGGTPGKHGPRPPFATSAARREDGE